MSKDGKAATIADEVPWSDSVTDYDRAHFPIYVRLLDAEAEGAPPSEIARVVLAIDPAAEPDRAKRCLASHLKRARWMTAHGFRQLLE
jgi:hypothetical protein